MQADLSPIIRRATLADAPALAELGAATFVESFAYLYTPEDLAEFLASSHSQAAYERHLRDPNVAIWLAETAGEPPIGYAIAGSCKLPVKNLEERAGEIRQLYVRAAFHGHKLGTKLLAHSARLARVTEAHARYTSACGPETSARNAFTSASDSRRSVSTSSRSAASVIMSSFSGILCQHSARQDTGRAYQWKGIKCVILKSRRHYWPSCCHWQPARHWRLAPSSSSPGADEAAIRAAGDAWNNAYNALNADALPHSTQQDAMLMPEAREPRRVRRDPRVPAAIMCRCWRRRSYTPAIANAVDIEVSGNLGFRSGTYSITDKSGAVVDTGKWLETWRKTDGKWHITRDIWNSDMLPCFHPLSFRAISLLPRPPASRPSGSLSGARLASPDVSPHGPGIPVTARSSSSPK